MNADRKSSTACLDCGRELSLSPPLAKRRGHDGRPMSRADALHLFVDSRGGRCVDCCLKRRSEETSKLCRQKLREPPSPLFAHLDMLMLRQRVLKLFGVSAGTRENVDRVNAMSREQLLDELAIGL